MEIPLNCNVVFQVKQIQSLERATKGLDLRFQTIDSLTTVADMGTQKRWSRSWLAPPISGPISDQKGAAYSLGFTVLI